MFIYLCFLFVCMNLLFFFAPESAKEYVILVYDVHILGFLKKYTSRKNSSEMSDDYKLNYSCGDSSKSYKIVLFDENRACFLSFFHREFIKARYPPNESLIFQI